MVERNKVLTPEEVLALDEGARVWVEMHRSADQRLGGVHTKDGGYVWNEDGPFTIGGDGHRAGSFRIWCLPVAPTPEELAANPWPNPWPTPIAEV